MIFTEPRLEAADLRVLELIAAQRERLRTVTEHHPRRWQGSLLKASFARAIQGTNTIEGIHATMDEALAAAADEPPPDDRTATWLAITGYRRAMTCIIQASSDPDFEFGPQVLKFLHFMMVEHDMKALPGRWRPGQVSVVREETGETVYEAPDAGRVVALIGELVTYLVERTGAPSLVTAAIAHLNLTMIHPFKDGNGRMARALQTLVLARDGILHPVFSSIEEWLGRNTGAYYSVLAEVGRGRWNPQGDALPWLRFCLRAHFQQAHIVQRRSEEHEALYDRIAELAAQMRLEPRMVMPLFDCALGLRLTNLRYQGAAEVSHHLATKDLRSLSDLGLIEPHGEKRGRFYTAGPQLQQARAATRRPRALPDPYAVISGADPAEPRLPGL